MKGAEAAIHFAAETHVDRSIDAALEFIRTNVSGAQVMLDAARECSLRRYLHISTDEVYGSAVKGSFDEDAPLKPNSPYSASKAGGDLLVRSHRETYGFPAIVIRSSNNYGPYQFPEKVIPLFITNLLEGKKVPLYKDGANIRDWIHVEDNCRAIELVFERGEAGTVYNVGGGSEITNLVLTRKILALMGKDDSMIEYVADRHGHDFRYSIQTERLRRLGFKPKWTFDAGLAETIRWYQTHSDWWKPLKADRYTRK